MDEKKTSILTILVVAIIAVLSLYAVHIGFSCISGFMNGEKSYEITISGFENYAINEPLEIYLPLPLINDDAFFSDDMYQNKQFAGWKSSIVQTPSGKMLSFHSTSFPVQNLHAEFRQTGILTHTLPKLHGDSSLTYAPQSVDNLSMTYMIDNYAYWGGPVFTYVYLPESLAETNADSVEIWISTKVKRTNTHFVMSSGMTYYLESHVKIPAQNISGFITIPGFALNVPWDVF
ncbi:hypothetical protein McpSp1_13790 [Methanocorpusculaceae archaeon Sp1]|nr:hypothetical protein [Methanocorpusculaceae archaeon Sp1]